MCRNVIFVYVACPALNILFHIISQSARFSGKRLLNTKFVFLLSLQILFQIFLILKIL